MPKSHATSGEWAAARPPYANPNATANRNRPHVALTPISPFRPRRWRGAILPDHSTVTLKVLEPAKRPVAAVADQKEVRDIAKVELAVDHGNELTLLFDPGHSLDERIVSEQFVA